MDDEFVEEFPPPLVYLEMVLIFTQFAWCTDGYHILTQRSQYLIGELKHIQ